MNTEAEDIIHASAKLANSAACAAVIASGHPCSVTASGQSALMVAQALQAIIRHATTITPERRKNLVREIIAAHGECVKQLGVIAAREPAPQPRPASPARPFHVIPGGADHA